jgi:alkylated DNA repair dioxygenase AlkB
MDMQLEYEVIKIAEGIELHYFPHWIEDPDRLLIEVEKLSLSPEIVTMWNKSSVVKRRTVDYGLEYGYNATAKRSIEWETPATAIRQRLEQQFRVSFRQCAVNEYIDHEAYISPHHDKPTAVDGEKREPLYVASLSVGAMRKMLLIPPDAKLKGIPITVNGLAKVQGARIIELAPGSLALFSNAFNRAKTGWKHSIPKDRKSEISGKRISLTYRHF